MVGKLAGQTRAHPIKLNPKELICIDKAQKIAFEWGLIERDSRYAFLRFAVKSVSDEITKRYNLGNSGHGIGESEEESPIKGTDQEHDSGEVLDEER